MISKFSGKDSTIAPSTDPKNLLIYWIKERYKIYLSKEAGDPKPWSQNRVFQNVYFCNLHRENDRVTKFIRGMYSPYVEHDHFLYNIILSRFINWPATLEKIGFLEKHDADKLDHTLMRLAKVGKVWGGAYIITTHGLLMGKAPYLANRVLGGVEQRLDRLNDACLGGSLAVAHAVLMQLEGLGSFLAAQVIADLKNTPGHPLQKADDWWTFVAPGPGSMRGASWFFYDEPDQITERTFPEAFSKIYAWLQHYWPDDIPPISAQDAQNALCEYDKFMRVTMGTGRSKRGYNGSN